MGWRVRVWACDWSSRGARVWGGGLGVWAYDWGSRRASVWGGG